MYTIYNFQLDEESLSFPKLSMIDNDINWQLELASRLRQKKHKKLIYHYRLPSSILVRMHNFYKKDLIDKCQLAVLYNEYYEYINKEKFINGFRSFKIKLLRLKITLNRG